MKTKTKMKVILTALLLITGMSLWAQNNKSVNASSAPYRNAIGLRAGETSGLTFKHMFGNGSAFEGIAGFWPYTVGFTGLFEKNISTNVSGLYGYLGAGGHINAGERRYRTYYFYKGREYVYVRETSDIAIGIDAIFGLEYKFKPIPLAISADVKPYIETSPRYSTFFTLDPSIGLKLTF